MKDITFLLQSGGGFATEKIACSFSSYKVCYSPMEKLSQMDIFNRVNYVPVGTVEFIREYCRHMQIWLPESFHFLFEEEVLPLYHRNVRRGLLKEANPNEFVKPLNTVKLFTGCLKSKVSEDIDPDTPVLISEKVTFGSEYRFYIQDFVSGPKILGWSRYDEELGEYPSPDFSIVQDLADIYHSNLGPNAYSIDIGWVKELQRYALVEVNDAWALGYYENTDLLSNPPSRQEYADMLVSRWRQILFCTLVS